MKKPLSILSCAVLALALGIFVFVAPTHASSQVTLVNSSETATQVSVGSSDAFTASIGGADSSQTVLIDLEVKDSNGQKIGQAFYDNQTIPAGSTQNFLLNSPTSLPAGNYSF